MNGTRLIGKRKNKLLNKISKIADLQAKYGVNVRAYFNVKYGCNTLNALADKLTTKELTSVVGEVAEL
jgi:hypothetical protein